MVLAPFVNYNMDAIFPFCAEAAQSIGYKNTVCVYFVLSLKEDENLFDDE
jgi:hypothetical protein